MKQPTKIFFAALIAAGAMWAGGALNSRRIEQRETELQSKCGAENIADHVNQALANSRLVAVLNDEEMAVLAKRRGMNVRDLVEQRNNERTKHISTDVIKHSATNPRDDDIPPSALNTEEVMWDRFMCGPEALSKRRDLVGLEADIAKAHQAALSEPEWPTQAALFLAAIGAIPWVWYFLLRRIAELRTALSGKPPI